MSKELGSQRSIIKKRALNFLSCAPGVSETLPQRLAWRFFHYPLLKFTIKLNHATGGFEIIEGDDPMTEEYKRFMQRQAPKSK